MTEEARDVLRQFSDLLESYCGDYGYPVTIEMGEEFARRLHSAVEELSALEDERPARRLN